MRIFFPELQIKAMFAMLSKAVKDYDDGEHTRGKEKIELVQDTFDEALEQQWDNSQEIITALRDVLDLKRPHVLNENELVVRRQDLEKVERLLEEYDSRKK